MRNPTQGKGNSNVLLRCLIAIWGLALLTSCSEGLLMGDGDSTSRSVLVKIQSFAPGQVQLAADSLPLKLDGVDAATWDVSLVSSAKVVLFQRSFSATDNAPPSLEAKDWETVLQNKDFTPRLVLQGQATEPGKSPVEFRVPFFLFRSLPQLTISTVPVEVEPEAWLGSQAFLSSSSADGSDAPGWIVWKVGGKTLTEGLLKDRSTFWWKAGSQPGTSEMSAEWYPEPPSTDPQDVVPPPVTVLSRPVVTATPRPITGELIPEESYAALWHFRGTLTDRISGTKLELSGKTDPSWIIAGGSLAVWLAPDSMLAGAGISYLQDAIKPFTLNLSLRAAPVTDPVVLWQTLDKDQNPLLQLSMLPGNRPVIRVYSAPGIYQEVGGDVVLGDEFTSVSISVFPSGKDWTVVWFVNGSPKQTGRFLAAAGLPSSIGGVTQQWSGPVWWDEAGLYVQTPDGVPSTDPEVFTRALESQYGTDLILAEGFDGLVSPPDWTFPKQDASLNVTLKPQESIISPVVNLPAGLLQFSQTLVPVDGSVLLLQAVDTTGKVLWKSERKPTDPPTLWDRRNSPATQARVVWKNLGSQDLSLDELAVFRKME